MSEHGGEIAEAVQRLRARYRKRADRGLVLFRLSGLVLIVAGSLMPALAIADYPGKPHVLAAVGVTMSLATSMHTFFRWDRQWQLLRNAQFRLENIHMEWQLAVAEAEQAGDEGRAAAITAHRKLLEGYHAIRADESEGFFSMLEFPTQADSQRINSGPG